MEQKIGEQFRVDGLLLEVKEADGCEGCYFNGKRLNCADKGFEGPCVDTQRSDNKSVIFALVDDGRKMTAKPIDGNGAEIITLSERFNPWEGCGYERYTLIKYKGMKFKAVYRNTASTLCGFDSNHCLSILSPVDMLWHDIADYREIDPVMRPISSYCDAEKHISQGDEFTRKCIEYIKLVY